MDGRLFCCALLLGLGLGQSVLAQPADCARVGDGPPMTLGLEVGLGDLPAPQGNTGGTAWVGMHDVPSSGTHCRATPLPQGDTLHGPPGDVLHGRPSPGGLLAGPPVGIVTVGPAVEVNGPQEDTAPNNAPQ